MDISNKNFLSIEEVQDRFLNQPKAPNVQNLQNGVSFKDILLNKAGRAVTEVKFSKHASNRLADRNISLSDEQMKRLNNAAQKASEKGIKESLVIVDSLAFIVNIPNNTVVTALDRSETDDNVFTNIDGAVII